MTRIGSATSTAAAATFVGSPEPSRGEVAESEWRRRVVGSLQHDEREQELVPRVHEDEHAERQHRRPHQREEDAAQDAHAAGAVDAPPDQRAGVVGTRLSSRMSRARSTGRLRQDQRPVRPHQVQVLEVVVERYHRRLVREDQASTSR